VEKYRNKRREKKTFFDDFLKSGNERKKGRRNKVMMLKVGNKEYEITARQNSDLGSVETSTQNLFYFSLFLFVYFCREFRFYHIYLVPCYQLPC
jgi:hypothetical protein